MLNQVEDMRIETCLFLVADNNFLMLGRRVGIVQVQAPSHPFREITKPNMLLQSVHETG
jgi:hypothetical protein